MKIVSNFNGDAEWGVVPYMHKTLLTFDDSNSSEVLMNGVEWIYNDEIKKPYQGYKRKSLLALWSPCEFTGKEDYYHFEHYAFFDDVFCVCPFTCEFMNQYFGYEKFYYIPYPFSNYSVKEFGQYDADCSWMGSVSGQDHISALETLFKFNYKFITSQKNTWMRHPYEFEKCTHVGLSPHDKLVELSKCKSSLNFNMIYMSPASRKNKFRAFEHFDQGFMPQLKVRTHEITSSKSLMIVKKDPWNLIEDFYDPYKEFVYFENHKELEDILNDVIKNFDKYQKVIEKAYTKSKLYKVEEIFKYIKTKDSSVISWGNKNTKRK